MNKQQIAYLYIAFLKNAHQVVGAMTDYYDDPSIIHKNMLIAALAKKQKGVHVVRLIKGNEIIKCINKYNTIKPASDKEKQKVSIDFTLQEINDILCRTGKTK